MKTHLTLLLALGILSISACKKDKNDPNGLPPATQEGKNTAGFLLDGQPWLPEWKTNLSVNSPVDASWQRTVKGRSLRFGFTRQNDSESNHLDFFVPHIRQTGTFELNQPASPTLGDRNPAYGIYVMAKEVPDRLFLTSPTATGTLTVTRFDTVAHIVSGTFELTVQEGKSQETHSVTEGRFDLRF
ncbi:hypothetical protein [Hymenobacter algoricola]|uniref:Uncharacterized protein n=1 Tax=Hymenobacter algoricola TaxID=486267 RepID=A0ABP7MYI9_9BACT